MIGEQINGRLKYQQVTSCLTPIANVQGKHFVTIEGLNMGYLSPAQKFIIEEAGTQCGFCTVGFVVSLSGFCLANSTPNYDDAIRSIDGNICRCTGYKSIERAARHITSALKDKDVNGTIAWLVDHKFIPSYFLKISNRLEEIGLSDEWQEARAIVGGGTDIYVQSPDDLVVQQVTPISENLDLGCIKINEDICTLGGACTITDLLESEELHALFPRLTEHVKLVSSSPIRNISTLAGNFVNASPIGDFTAFFLTLNAKITLNKNRKYKSIYLR